MKLKHNKIKNTYLIYELLSRQILSEAMKNENSKAIDIIKKYFYNSEILKEHKIFSYLLKERSVSEEKASIILQTALEAHKKINKDKLRKEKYNLISEIKNNFELDEFFKAKIENYKILASISCLLENYDSSDISINELSKFKFYVLESIMQSKKQIKESSEVKEFSSMDKGTRNLVYKILISKFNSKYNELDDNQSDLLREYINNISITPKLKEYVDDKLIDILKEINELYNDIPDKITRIKIKEIANISKNIIDSKSINDDDISYVLNAFELVKELKKLNGSESKD